VLGIEDLPAFSSRRAPDDNDLNVTSGNVTVALF